MKNALVRISKIALAIIVLSYGVYALSGYFTLSPASNQLAINNLYRAVTDSQKNLYLIVDSREGVVKINSQGVVEYRLSSGEKGVRSIFDDLDVDSKGNLYALVAQLDSQGIYVESEEIVRYTPGGRLDGVLYRVSYMGDNRPLRKGRIRSFQVQGDNLYFFFVEDNSIRLNKLVPGLDIVQPVQSFELPPDAYLKEVVGTSPDNIFYSTYRGEIYRLKGSYQTELIYPVGAAESEKTFPAALRLISDKLYFIETQLNDIRYLDFKNPTAVAVHFPPAVQPGAAPLSVIKDLGVAADGTGLIGLRDRIIWAAPNGDIQSITQTGAQPGKTVFLQWLVWLMLLIIAALLIYLARIVYVDLLQRRMPLMLKQVAVFVPVIVIAMALLSQVIYKNASEREEAKMFDELVLLTNINKNRIDTDQMARLTSPRNYMNEDYQALRSVTVEAQMNEALSSSNQRLDEVGLYSGIYKLENGKLYSLVDYDNSVNMFRPVDIVAEYKRVIEERRLITDKGFDENGSWMFAMAPLFDRQGNMVGIYETGVDLAGFERASDLLLQKVAKIIALITAVVVVIFMFMNYFILISIRTLRRSAQEIASGNWDTRVNIKTRDEIADLGDQFNLMAEHIKNYIQQVTRLSESYFRFVPHKFLQLLGKESILDVELGDQVKQETTILVSQMRSFYLLSEKMTPEDNFNFINSYLKRFVPYVRNHDGFVDDYTGAGVVALFPNDAESALKSAIDIRKEVAIYNQHRQNSGYEPIDIGIGIHIGSTMLGVIGEEQRLAARVISDNVNLATALEKLTEEFGAWILLTEDTLKAIPHPERYQYRSIGKVRIEGKDEYLGLYDFFEGDPEDICRLKQLTKDMFEEGVMLYQDGAFYDARAKFLRVIKLNQQDKMAQLYFFLCDEYFRQGAPEGWNGTLSA